MSVPAADERSVPGELRGPGPSRLRITREIKLPRLRRLPRRVVALDAERNPQGFTLRLHWNGRLTAARERGAKPAGGPFVLALDPSICFRRRDRVHPRSRTELKMLAPDLFPFVADATHYAVSRLGGNDAHYCALPNDELTAILDRFPAPASVIVAPPDARALERAVEERLDVGDIADLLPGAGHLINPAMVLGSGLAALVVAGIVASALLWNANSEAALRAQRAELARLQGVTARLVDRRQAILRMSTVLQQQEVFAQRPSGEVIELIAKVLAALPDGAFVERIEYAKQSLAISGWGNNAPDWVKAAGLNPARVTTEKMPLNDRFVITFNLPAK
jgi:hypothetical protein